MADTSDTPCATGCCGAAAPVPDLDDCSTTSSTAYCGDSEKCDEECIKAAAALECKLACDAEIRECSGDDAEQPPDAIAHSGHTHFDTHLHAHGDNGDHPSEPCISHIQAAMNRYAAFLQSARCVCLNAIEAANKATQAHAHASASASQPVPLAYSILPCGKSTAFSQANRSGVITHRGKPKEKKPMANLCYSSTTGSINEPPEQCDKNDGVTRGGCCGQKPIPTKADKFEKVRISTTDDIELAPTVRNHVLLNVGGMTCTGCANNLTQALQGVPGTANVKVNFVTNMAELDLDPTITETATVTRLAERATGYKLTAFNSDNQTLDIILEDSAAKYLQTSIPAGVESCSKISKTVYEVNYDPCIIRAREVLQRSGGKLAPPRADSSLDAGRRRLVRIIGLTSVAFILSMPVVVLEWGDFNGIDHTTVMIVSIVLATLVQCLAYPEFYKPALSSLIYSRVLEMDMLVVISITAAYGYSIVASGLILDGRNLETEPFFETSTLLITLVLFGRLLAAWARKRAVSKVSLRSLQASTAVLVDPSTSTTTEMDARLLQFGDIIQVKPHSQVVTDALVTSGVSEVDESMLTGESLPVHKTIGSSVISGTINGTGTLTARITRLPGKNTITDIANLVEQAQSSKPRIQDLADKVAGYFVPVVCTAAVIVFVIWIAVCLRIRDQAPAKAIGTAISYGIAVLAVSCPCALGLAVPMVLVIAGGIAAQGGIVIKTADVTERGHKVTDVIFDKTGTLTENVLEIVDETFFNTELDVDILSLVKALVKDNKHPVSAAVSASLEKRATTSLTLDALSSIPGCGMQATFNGTLLRGGNSRWLKLENHPTVKDYTSRGMTLLCITSSEANTPIALFGLKSALRPEAHHVVSELTRRNIGVHIVSGDNAPVVHGIANALGIPSSNIASEQSPADKQMYVSNLMSRGRTTLFCGDGTNDAVAVAQASVGVQIESTSDVTRSTADVVLLGGLDGIVGLLDISRAAYRRIIFNFVWSAVYNVLAMLLAGGAFVRVRIPPAFAGLGEIVSVLPVIIVALTMPKVKKSM